MEPVEKKERFTLGHALLLVSALLVLGSLYWGSYETSLGVLIGSGIGLANYYLYSVMVRGLTGVLQISKARLFLVVSLKMLILFMIIGLILLKTSVRPLPLLVGLSNIFGAVLLYGTKDIWHA